MGRKIRNEIIKIHSDSCNNYVINKYKQNWINHLERMDKTDARNTLSTTNPEDEDLVDALGNEGNASMPEQVKRLNPWRKMMMMMMMMILHRNMIIYVAIPTTIPLNLAPVQSRSGF